MDAGLSNPRDVGSFPTTPTKFQGPELCRRTRLLSVKREKAGKRSSILRGPTIPI